VSKLKRLLCYESQHQSQSNDKSLVQFDYEKAVSNYLGTQSTFKQHAKRAARWRKSDCVLDVNDFVFNSGVEPDSLIAILCHFLAFLSFGCL